MFSPCSKTLNIAKADWKCCFFCFFFFSKSWLRILLTLNAVSFYRVKSFAVKEKKRNFRFHLFTITPNVILNESSHTSV